MMKRKYWFWGLGVILTLLAAYFILSKDKSLKVAIEEVSKHDLIETVSGSGKIAPETEIKISPDASGELITLNVKEGESVRKGQLLATVKSISTQSIFNIALPQAAGMGKPTETIKNINIYAPISGMVSGLNVRKGEKVAGGGQIQGIEMMRIADMSRMKLDISISENEIQKVKIGDTAIIHVEAYNEQEFKGIVSSISQTNSGFGLQQSIASITDQMTNYTVSIFLLPESYAGLIKPGSMEIPFRSGMSASADVQTQYQRGVIAVPINAVTTREDEDSVEVVKKTPLKEYVFVVNDKNEAIQTEVKTSIQDNQYIQILSGISEKQKVIVAPYSAIARTLKDKMKVKIVSRKELYQVKED